VSAGALFDDAAMAGGYAHDRPPVHPKLMARLRAGAAWAGPAGIAVDVGCGAGASTAALRPLARRVIGVDPYEPMVRAACEVVRGATFAVATAEALPCAAGSVDLLAAAGALNYADLDAFVRDAERVLAPAGLVAVSNYGFGRPVGDGFPSDWPERFARRWPRPASARVDAASFAGAPFRVVVDEQFTVSLPMTPDAYLAYLMTDTAVAQAIAGGTPSGEIRSWCATALREGFRIEQLVTFDCSLIVLSR
jgi:ubiquinone/menaquinone biosynthesis C-methylase UbiE